MIFDISNEFHQQIINVWKWIAIWFECVIIRHLNHTSCNRFYLFKIFKSLEAMLNIFLLKELSFSATRKCKNALFKYQIKYCVKLNSIEFYVVPIHLGFFFYIMKICKKLQFFRIDVQNFFYATIDKSNI